MAKMKRATAVAAVAILAAAAPASSAQEAPQFGHHHIDGTATLDAPQLKRGDDGMVRFAAWQEPDSAFAVRDTFINSEFLTIETASPFPPNAVMGFSESACPEGWDQLEDDDGTPLFFAFNLLVDAEGAPRSGFVKVPACVKR